MTAAQIPQPTSSDGPTRRDFLERGAAATGAVVTIGVGGSAVAPQFSPVGRAQGIACGGLCIGAAAAGTGVAVGWALGEWDPLEDDSPPEGQTADGLQNSVFETTRTRASTNASTFLDNQNILSGVEHAAYSEGKIAGIEALNAQETEQTFQDESVAAGMADVATTQSNFLKTWNESVREWRNMVSSVKSHPDLNLNDVFSFGIDHDGASDGDYAEAVPDGTGIESVSTITLADGTDFDAEDVVVEATAEDVSGGSGGSWQYTWNPSVDPSSLQDTHDVSDYTQMIYDTYYVAADGVQYMLLSDWFDMWTEIRSVEQTVNDGLITWCGGVYGEVQSGELDTSDLLTPRELAEMSADEEEVNQAIADLMALNIPVDLEREATISVESENETATLSGMLAPTDPPDAGIVASETYNPSEMSGDIYFNYDVSQGSAVWTGYESAVDGGIVTFTAEPYEGTLFTIQTAADEEATVAASDFEPDSEDNPTAWTVDISSQVETGITEIDEIGMVSESGDTDYRTIILDQTFTVEKIENSDGEEADSMSFSKSEQQDDSNYISEDEWKEMEQRNQELIDKYEESKNDGGGSIIDPDALAEDYGGAVAGLIIIFVTLSTVVGYVTGNIPGMGD